MDFVGISLSKKLETLGLDMFGRGLAVKSYNSCSLVHQTE